MVSLSEMAAAFLLLVAFACLHALDTVLDFWQRGRVFVVPAVLLALFTTYLMGTILVYIRVSSPAASALVSSAAAQRFATLACAMACALLLLFVMPLMPFHFLAAGW